MSPRNNPKASALYILKNNLVKYDNVYCSRLDDKAQTDTECTDNSDYICIDSSNFRIWSKVQYLSTNKAEIAFI